VGGEDRPWPVEEALREQLRLAMASARVAYQDSSRLIRLLTILQGPGSPEDLIDEALTTLSDVFAVDVASVVRLVGGRLVVTASCGLPEGDPAFVTGWEPCAAARQALRDGQARSLVLNGAPDGAPDGEATLARNVGLRSGVWLPLAGDNGRRDHLLILYRREENAFSRSEMELLSSVTNRLLTAIQSRWRSAVLERLARSGHVLSRNRRIGPVLRDATRLLGELVAARRTAAFSVTGGNATPVVQAKGGGARRATGSPDPPWNLGGGPAQRLPGWTEVLDGAPHLLRPPRPEDVRHLLVVPVGPEGSPAAILYAAWEDLPPLMLPATEASAIFATTVTVALENASLYHALSASETSLRVITDSITDLIAVVDGSCRFLYASASYDRAIGHAPGSLIGHSLLDLVEHDDRLPLRNALLASASTASVSTIEYRLRTGDGDVVWAESRLRPAALSDRRVVMSTRLIHERKLREEELRHQAAHDPLTGLANRASAMERLEDALSTDGGGEIGLLFCDLDKFKEVNDSLGHAVGDDLLQQVAERLRGCTRTGDLIARLGGDEFVFILDDVTNLDEVTEVGRRVAASMARPFVLGDKTLTVSASIGAAVGRRGEASPAKMLSSADAAMYAAKRGGTMLDRSAVTRVVG
jgi:diguanylate cyclase (GGDEF)-like protein/PAS domain S-box-containing protein